MSHPALAAAVPAAPPATAPRDQKACMEDRIDRLPRLSTRTPATFWETSTTASTSPTPRSRIARTRPEDAHPTPATSSASATVPQNTTRRGPKRPTAREGSTVEPSEPAANAATTKPKTRSSRPHCCLSVGYQGSTEAKTAPLVANMIATPTGLRERPGAVMHAA